MCDESDITAPFADGTFIVYVKAARGFDDTFIAGMRVSLVPYTSWKRMGWMGWMLRTRFHDRQFVS